MRRKAGQLVVDVEFRVRRDSDAPPMAFADLVVIAHFDVP